MLLHIFNKSLSVVGPVVTLLRGTVTDIPSAAEILLICKSVVLKLRGNAELGQSLFDAFIEIAERIDLEVSCSKR